MLARLTLYLLALCLAVLFVPCLVIGGVVWVARGSRV